MAPITRQIILWATVSGMSLILRMRKAETNRITVLDSDSIDKLSGSGIKGQPLCTYMHLVQRVKNPSGIFWNIFCVNDIIFGGFLCLY